MSKVVQKLETRLRTRRGRLVAAAVVLVLGATLVPNLAGAALPGSDFDATDGNQKVDAPEKDWLNAPNFSHLTDAAIKLKQTDDFYQGGPKHDDLCPTVKEATAGLPGSKDDLRELYVAHETAADGDIFLYLAWERLLDKESSASAHEGFEFNQSRTDCGNGANSLRTAGDILIQYDLEGGGNPSFHLYTWLTGAPFTAADCEASQSLPCWGDEEDLNASGLAQGSVNTGPILAADDATPDTSIGFSRQFGEGAINLTEAGVFQAGQCRSFGNALLASRSSGNSFSAGLDDLVGPLAIDINNCGSLKIVKHDDGGANLAGAKFKVFKDDGDEVFEPGAGDVQVGSECTTTANGTGDCTFANLLIGGEFWVQETQAPTGYVITGTNPVLVEITGTGVHTVTFTNSPAEGDVKVVKTGDDGALLAGVKFTLVGTSDFGTAVNLECTTGDGVDDGVNDGSNSDGSEPTQEGTCSFLNVELGTYTLDEDAATLPAGYAKDPNLPKNDVTIASDGQVVTVNVTNPRTHRVIVLVCHEGSSPELLATSVANGTSTKNSVGDVPAALSAKGVTEADLCGVGGASFGQLGHTNKTTTASIASH